MSIPPFLQGAALVFWGWHTGLWWLGLLLGLLAELPRAVTWRWELGLRERWRVADLCSVLLVLAGVYLYLTQPRLGSAMLVLIQWSPLLLFPMLAVQIYGGRDGVELSTLFMSLRRGDQSGEEQLDLRGAYLLICLVAAAMEPIEDRLYYPLLALLAVWALWPLRPRRRIRVRSVLAWGGLLLTAAIIGHGVTLGLQRAQLVVGDWVVEWLAGRSDGSTDPYRASTAIGQVGELKLSERIVLRVRPERPLASAVLLRRAGYNRYYEGSWLAAHSPFRPLEREADGWRLPGEMTGAELRRLKIDLALEEGRGILPLPPGARRLRGLKGAELQSNGFGALKVLEGPPRARYGVDYGAPFADLPPDEVDLRLPDGEREALDRVVAELGLEGLEPARVMQRLQAWLLREFRYSLRLEAPAPGQSALAEFLLHRRSGHCEYFASAAVLLLRRAGIPARYVVGWSLQEYSPLEEAYVVRARHAHAWALAWVDGAWREFDPTPPDWSALEAEQRPWWASMQDLLSRLAYLLVAGEEGENRYAQRLGWLLIPLVVLLGWRVARRGRIRRSRKPASTPPPATPFTPVERLLARRGAGRLAGETLAEWLVRLEGQGEPAAAQLRPALELYYRRRFDPTGLDGEGTRRLEEMIQEWLERNR